MSVPPTPAPGTPAPDTTAPSAQTRRSWAALAVLLLALAMALFDITIVNITLPSVTESLTAHPGTLSWLVAGYILGYALSLVPAGRLGDRIGHKTVFIAGATGYVLTGILVSLAWNEHALIALRVLHGIAGGFMIAPITAMIAVMFAGVRLARAFGLFAATTGVASLIGPVLGGAIIDTVGLDNGWRWALAVGLPLGVVAVLLAFPLLPSLRGNVTGRFDSLGMLLLGGLVITLLAPLIQGLPSWAWESLAVAAVLLVLFILRERHVERRGGTPVLRLSHFRKAPFSLGLLGTVLGFASFTSSIYIAVATVWQFGRGESALQAALVMLSFGLGAVVGGVLDDRLTLWFRRWDVFTALAFIFVGYAVSFILFRQDAAGVSLWALAGPMLLAGIGCGGFIGLNMASVLSTVPDGDAGSVGGLVITAQRLGSALGAAIVLYVTSLPAAAGASEAQRWLENGVNGVLACTVFAGVAVLALAVVAARTPRGAILGQAPTSSDKEQEPLQHNV